MRIKTEVTYKEPPNPGSPIKAFGDDKNCHIKGWAFFIILFSFAFILPSVASSATVPGAPTIGTATAGDDQATVSFTPPASNGGSAITSYTVTSSPGGITGTGPSSPIKVSGCCGLNNGTAYTFTVTATNAVGTSAASGASNSVTPVPMVPGAPTAVFASAGNTQATVTFTAPASNGDIIGIYYYTVTSSPGGFTGTGPASGITVSGLTNGTAYTFTVTATNDVGPGAASVPSNSVVPAVPDITSGLVGDWALNEGTGTVAHDSSGLGNNGTIAGTPTWGAGLAGGSLSLDGVTSSIDVPNNANLSPTGALTVSALIKPIGKGTNSGADYLTVFQKGHINYALSILQGGTIGWYLTGVKNWISGQGSTKNLFDGVWHHLVATYDGNFQTIYIDGQLIAATAITGNITPDTNDVQIGSGFLGQMENVRMYNRALNQGDVEELYSSYGPVHTSPVTYYISSSQGNDNNDGLSPSTPWQNLDMIYQAEFVPNKIAPGDSILFKRGDTWEGQITLNYFGQTGAAPITIGSYVGPNGTSSDPKPIIYGDGRYLSWEPVAGQPAGVYQAYIGEGSSISVKLGDGVYENNTAYTYSLTPLSLTPGTWGLPYGSGSAIWIYTSDGNPPNNIRVFRDATINMYKANNIVVQDLDLRETYTAVYTYLSNAIDVKNNNTLDTLGSALSYSHAMNSIMENNIAGPSGCTTLYFEYNGSNNIMRNNTINGATTPISGIAITPGSCDGDAIGLMDGTGDLIEHNTILHTSFDFYFENNSIIRYNKVTSTVLTDGIWPDGTNLTIFGNIARVPNVFNTGTEPINIFNNVIIGQTVFSGTQVGSGPILFENNIVFHTTNSAPIFSFGTEVTSDHNCFYSNSGGAYYFNGVKYNTLSAYQTASGQDAHSVYGNPLLDANDSITASSPCQAQGVDVSSLINFPFVDYAGNPFLQGSNPPDIGAFEYTPTTLTVTLSGSGSGTVTSSSAGINCGSVCSATFSSSGIPVTLTAAANGNSTFAGWSGGGCSGTAPTCIVTMSSSQAVTANFTPGIMYGDVNGALNGSEQPIVTIYDAEMTAQYAIGLSVSNFNAAAAKVDGNNTVDIYDAFLIAEYAVGVINTFPVQQ